MTSGLRLRRAAAPRGGGAASKAGASELRFLVASLGSVAFGVFVGVALLQYHFVHAGKSEPSWLLQSLVVGIYRLVGFVPAIYLCLLLVLWGGVAFVGGSLAGPLRRIGASLLFCLFLAMLTASLGGDGGALGERVATRLGALVGPGVGATLLAAMSFAALVLATDWFFFRSFLRRARPPFDATEDAGVMPIEEDDLAELRVSPAEERAARPSVAGTRAATRAERGAEGSVARAALEQEWIREVLAETEPEPEGAGVELRDMDEGGEEEEAGALAEFDDEALLARAGRVLDEAWGAEASAGPAAGPPVEPDAAQEEPAGPITHPVAVAGVIADEESDDPQQGELFAEEPPDGELIETAARVVLTARRPTPTLLQRRLRIGYAQARQVLGVLGDLGVVEEPEGSGPWEPLIDLAEWERRRGA